MRKEKISIIIPVKNCNPSFYNCINSIYKSKDINYELIIILDSKKYSKDENPIKIKKGKIYYLHQNYGVSYARNYGAKKAKNNILCFIDYDVRLDQNTLRDACTEFKNKEYSLCFSNYRKISKKENQVTKFYNSYMRFIFFNIPNNSAFNSTFFIIKKNLFLDFDITQRSVEDAEIVHRYRSKGIKINKFESIKVNHLKKLNLKELTNLFLIRSYDTSKLCFKLLKEKKIYSDSSVKLNQKINLFLIPFTFLFIIIFGLYGLILSIIMFLIFNLNFILFYFKEYGFNFTVFSICIYFYINIIIQLGVFIGGLNNILLLIKNKC
jgi:glycosyltransferase involved in cell wall biosynthesis